MNDPDVHVPAPLWRAVVRLVEAIAHRLETSPTFRLCFPADARAALQEIRDAAANER